MLGLNDQHQFKHYQYELAEVEHILIFTDGWLDNQHLDEVDQIVSKLNANKLYNEDFAYGLWQASQVKLSEEVDDASLIVINKH